MQAQTLQIMAKIIATGLTPIGRVSDLKLDMLEAVDTIAETGKFYHWAQYVIDMLKTICEKCQESVGIIRFPSLIIWIVMYHLCPVGDNKFLEPTKYHMWLVQTIFIEWNAERTGKWKSTAGKLVPDSKSPDN